MNRLKCKIPSTWILNDPQITVRKEESAGILRTHLHDIKYQMIEYAQSLSPHLVQPFASDFPSDSSQEAWAGHCYFVSFTFYSHSYTLYFFKALKFGNRPAALFPHATIFWLFRWVPISTFLNFGQSPPRICLQPLSPIWFLSELRRKYGGQSPPTASRRPWRDVCSSSHWSYWSLNFISALQTLISWRFFQLALLRTLHADSSNLLPATLKQRHLVRCFGAPPSWPEWGICSRPFRCDSCLLHQIITEAESPEGVPIVVDNGGDLFGSDVVATCIWLVAPSSSLRYFPFWLCFSMWRFTSRRSSGKWGLKLGIYDDSESGCWR